MKRTIILPTVLALLALPTPTPVSAADAPPPATKKEPRQVSPSYQPAPAPATTPAPAQTPARPRQPGDPAPPARAGEPRPAPPGPRPPGARPGDPRAPGDPARPPLKSPREVKADFDASISTLNSLAERPINLGPMLKKISELTGASIEQLQAQRRKFTDVGIAGLLFANTMAGPAKKPADRLLQERFAGRSWDVIARENQVPLPVLIERAKEVEQAALSAAPPPR